MTLPEGTKPGEGPIPANDTLEDMEKAYLIRLVKQHAGNFQRIQQHAKVARATLYRRIKILGLEQLVEEARRGQR